jgi:hypothetical protein
MLRLKQIFDNFCCVDRKRKTISFQHRKVIVTFKSQKGRLLARPPEFPVKVCKYPGHLWINLSKKPFYSTSNYT